MKKIKEFCVDKNGKLCYFYYNTFIDNQGNFVKIQYGGIKDIYPKRFLELKTITNGSLN